MFNIFKKRKPKYYVEVVRVWEGHSYYTPTQCMVYAHPIFLIKKRCLFKKDETVNMFWYTYTIEDALDEVRKLNGSDYIANEEAIKKYGIEHKWDDETHASSTYILTHKDSVKWAY